MSEFIKHVLGELKRGRISRAVALDLLGRHAARSRGATAAPAPAPAFAPQLATEDWVPRAPDAGGFPIRRLVCVAQHAWHGALAAAFAREAPQVDVSFVPMVHTRDEAAAALGAIAGDANGFDAFVFLPNPTRAADAADVEDILTALQGRHDARMACARTLLCGAYDDALSRCHVESWIGIERTFGVLAADAPLAVLATPVLSSDEAALRAHVARILRELGAGTLRSARFNAGDRNVLQLTRTDTARNAPRLRHRGTYLITGGAGSLGIALARHLWHEYGANLILTGRSALRAQRAERIDRLRHEGAEVVYAEVDVADAEAMQHCVRNARARFGALHGAIHAAGIEGRGVFFDNDMERVRQVLRPKVQGTRVLDAALRECSELEFLCCFSSTSAVLGDFGSVDYAVANRFQMAYAQAFGTGGGPRLLSIGWPFWDGDGMGGGDDPERTRLYLASSGQRPLQHREGLQLFERLLGGEGGGFRLVSTVDVDRLIASLDARGVSRGDAPLVGAAGAPSSATSGEDGLQQRVTEDLKRQIVELLKLSRDAIRPRQNLTEYGFDSITLARWARRIAQHFAIDFSPAVFFSHPTLRQVADYLTQNHAAQLRAAYRAAEAAPAPDTKANSAATPAPSPATAPRAPVGIDEQIAIVGMSGRFPQARNVDELWQILAQGRDVVSEIPLQRFDWRGYFGAPEGEPRMTSKWLGVLPGIDEFDPLFFEISPREAQSMDPRQRLLLQEAWSALEDAGYAERQCERETIGTFVGVEQGEYQFLAAAHGTLTGNHEAILASRLSYVLDLHGPVLAINTSCSSGLVAAHHACLSLRANDCDAAVVAAVNLVLAPHAYLGMSRAGMLSAHGRCYAFDERADGMVPGEAVVAVVLKRLSRARAAGDPIHAVIVASGINYDGKTNGITAPNGAAQAALIEQIHSRAGIRAADIDYVVAHGTATRLGDPVEVAALDRAFAAGGCRRTQCALTSTKSNLGHTFAASGLVSLVSLVLALRHETIPASLHCEQLSDYIDWANSAFYVNRANKHWPRDAARARLGAVSAFGMSGTNAHLVLRDEAPAPPGAVAQAPAVLLAFSAATERALAQRMDDACDLLRDGSWDKARLAALSHTLLVHRRHFAHRCAVVVEDAAQALTLLSAARDEQHPPALWRGKVPADFEERPALAQHAQQLLRGLAAQSAQPLAYRESLAALADVYCRGYRPDWETIHASHPPQRLRLPPYPFARQRYWIDAADAEPPHETVAPDIGEAAATATTTVGVQHIVPRWDVADAAQFAQTPHAAFACASERPLVIGGGTLARACLRARYPHALLSDIAPGDDVAAITRKLAQAGAFDHVVWIAPQSALDGDAQLIDVQDEGVLHLFRLIKALLWHGLGERDLAWTVVTFAAVQTHRAAVIDPSHTAVHGLIGSLAKEMPRWSIRLLDLESDADWYVSDWTLLPADARARPWAYRAGRWHRQQLLALRTSVTQAPIRVPGQVYVVVGGAGHVGTAWTEHVIRTQQAQVVWLGRRPKDARIQSAIDRLGALGITPDYIAADAADACALEAAYREIVGRYGRIDGVVFSQIHLEPCALGDMDEARFRVGLRAKVDASVRVLEAFRTEPLKLVLFFSSVISFIRNPLQGAYAAGCAFSDAFALALRQRWSAPDAPAVKIMNWGFWDRPENLQLEGFAAMAQMGIGLITADEAMHALDCLLSAPVDQIGIVKTTKPVLIEGMNPKSSVAVYAERAAPDMTRLEQRVRAAATRHESALGNWSTP